MFCLKVNGPSCNRSLWRCTPWQYMHHWIRPG